VAQLHGALSRLGKETAVTESADEVNPEQHEIVTGSRPGLYRVPERMSHLRQLNLGE
jgi:hypothetical protein